MVNRWMHEDDFLYEEIKSGEEIEENLDGSIGILIEDDTEEPSSKKKTRGRKGSEPHPLDLFGDTRKSFISRHYRTLHHEDIAMLLGLRTKELEDTLEKLGVKLPVENTRKWKDVELGEFVSLEECSRCQVQKKHSSFFVGIKNCRECFTKNIEFWIKKGIHIKVSLPGEE